MKNLIRALLLSVCLFTARFEAAAVTVFFGFSATNVNEGTAIIIPVRLSAATNRNVTLNYSRTGGTASVSGVGVELDVLGVSGTLTIRSNTTTTNIVITTFHTTSLDEANETVTITLGPPSNATLGSPSSCTGTIIDNDPPPTVSWGSSVRGQESVTSPALELSANSGMPVSVTFSVTGGTATAGADYSVGFTTVTIPPESGGTNIPLTIINDLSDEESESIDFLITSASNAVLPGVTFRDHAYIISDNDNPPTISFSAASASGSENVSGSVSLNVSVPSGKTITGDISFSGTAKATNPNRDFTLSLYSFTLPPGVPGTNIAIQVINDARDETNETVVLNMNSVLNATETSPATYTYTINDNDNPPTVSFADNVGSGFESNAPVIVVQLSQTSDLSPSVDCAVVGGTASGSDYMLAPGTLVFGPTNLTLTLPLLLLDDGLAESSETLKLQLSNPTNTALGVVTTNLFTILDTGVAATAPELTVTPVSLAQMMVSWSPATPGFVLQETWVLSPSNWTNSPSGETNPITVPATLPMKFYRLFKP